MATVKDLVEAAFALRSANNPESLAGPGELVLLVDRLVKGIYQDVAKVNPRYFGFTSDVDPSSSKWAWPATAALVYHLEAVAGGSAAVTAGTEITRIELAEADAFDPPRVYRLGRYYYSVGEDGDPVASAGGSRLRFHCAMRHPSLDPTAALDDAANTLDPSWNDDFSGVLIHPIARYLAVKDGRGGTELEAYVEEEKAWRALLLAEAQESDHGMSARFSDGRLPSPVAARRS